MRKMLIFAVAVLCISCWSAGESFVKFPAADKKGGMPLNEALNNRRTLRKYSTANLSVKQIGDLLWAAYGVNRADGKLTAPTAANRQEIRIYFLTKEGAFAYCPVKHAYKKIDSADLRKYAGVFKAPLYVVIAADLNKAANRHYAVMDTGYVSQNIYLHCASAGLGTCAIGSFTRIREGNKGKVLRDGLKLPAHIEIFLTHSVGVPAK
ncbi:MAG: nitroreductase family protein [Lentisphaeria bacterium]|nr:nitroreductase family protein [Lentisphaeria bacterium]